MSLAPAFAQSEGNNAICSDSASSTLCAATGQPKASWSAAYIDAAPFSTTSNDICTTLFDIISPTAFVSGTVVDARGINASNSKHDSTNSDLLCADTPWAQGSSSTAHSATILLPAATIEVSAQWVLPTRTRLIGEGPGGTGAGATTLAACDSTSCTTTFPSNLAVLKMGAAAGANGISIENLAINGNSVAGVSGIANSLSQQLSYVNHVSMYNILGTGLSVAAANSGPYSDISFSAGGSNSICVSIQGATTNTSGFEGITCTGPTSSPFPNIAIVVNAPNNMVRDVQVSGFTNGVIVGNSTTVPVQSVVLSNIRGGAHVTNVVNIVNGDGTSNVVATGIYRNGATNAIEDQTLPSGSQLITDGSVAIYVLGDKMGGAAAYSRFTTSPDTNVVNWSVGATTPGSSCTNTGSLYSNTAGGAGTTWYTCAGGQWKDIQ
jgi:hypothetical protein